MRPLREAPLAAPPSDPVLCALEAHLVAPYRERAVVLRDGRHLAVSEFGDPDGDTVLWFHGTPGARRQLPPGAEQVARAHGMRIVGVDRPGVGDSTPHPERTLLSWADDVRQLVDHLGVERFGVAGISGGGPHVLAVAHALAERVTGAALLGSMAPLVGPEAPSGVPSFMPRLMGVVHALRGPVGDTLSGLLKALPARAAHRAFPTIMRLVPEVDRVVLDTPQMRAMFVSDIYLGSRRSFRAQIQDVSAYGRPWGFSLQEIRVPMRLWHGSEDQLVPLSHAKHLCALLPRAELTVFEGEGHFAGFVRPKQVLSWLADRASACT